MNQVAETGYRWGICKFFSLLSTQPRLTHEQRLRLKKDGRPCPTILIKSRVSDTYYRKYSWICGDDEKNTYYCWPCLVMGDHSNKVSLKFPSYKYFWKFLPLNFYSALLNTELFHWTMLLNCLYFVHLSSTCFCMKDRIGTRARARALTTTVLTGKQIGNWSGCSGVLLESCF